MASSIFICLKEHATQYTSTTKQFTTPQKVDFKPITGISQAQAMKVMI
ncbi:MAG: hypothetical protein MJZ13_00615 [Bacteroidales bacterium]|nr:hypothetical protein [Bacteroidales bacterium]